MSALRAHAIPKRDIQFDLSGIDLRHWHPGGPQSSHYFNVQSLLFPQGERFFIRSVRHFRDGIRDPALQQQVAGFIAQEAMHGREHDAYNAALRDIGYPVERMERWVAFMLWFADKTMTAKDQLAMTVSLEHLTAIGAEDLLADDRILEGADPRMARLWRWHAMEETEHKAVAFDVYRDVAGTGFTAWLRRCFIMLTVSLSMQSMIWAFMLMVTIRDRSIFSLSGWGRLFWSLWVTPGALRRQVPRYWQYFKPGFHPWQIDNYQQIERWRSDYVDDEAGSVPADAASAQAA